MPIRPENRGRYPANWKQIREAILTRADWCCEQSGCGVRNYSVGHWLPEGIFRRVTAVTHQTYREARQHAADWHWSVGDDEPAPIVIVLTIAHLDHTPENCDPANLRALCQRHHLALDADHHKATAYATRRARLGNLELEL